jgi:hypothetical protein
MVSRGARTRLNDWVLLIVLTTLIATFYSMKYKLVASSSKTVLGLHRATMEQSFTCSPFHKPQ